ncbi:MAG: Ribulose-phosphate 3-epimerase [Parcubacteria group bacterium GW2011_GWA2_47_26]|nr:MAG: Ribulose-phosphate 3-epimerase [Parcubacteria group bacterium GW2011_GWA2_47_26]
MKREIIPVILAKNFLDFKKKLAVIKTLKPKPRWIQIDVVDGKFAPFKTLANPKKIAILLGSRRSLASEKRRLKPAATFDFEVDLMVVDPLQHAKAWIQAGAKRILFHVEVFHKKIPSLKIREEPGELWDIIKYIKSRGVEVGPSLNAATPIGILEQYLALPGSRKLQLAYHTPRRLKPAATFDCILLLGVNPGRSGQPFQRHVLKKIRALRKKYPHLPIEVDGGVNLSNAEEILKAGATRIATASALHNAASPQVAYQKFLKVADKFR